MDLAMPVMNGWDATRWLTEDPLTEHVPVIAVTAQDHEPSQLLQAGFCGYIRKPIALHALANAVEYCLGRETGGKLWVEIPGGTPDCGSVHDSAATPGAGRRGLDVLTPTEPDVARLGQQADA
jgi:DNA-binding response OmpR family regulator